MSAPPVPRPARRAWSTVPLAPTPRPRFARLRPLLPSLVLVAIAAVLAATGRTTGAALALVAAVVVPVLAAVTGGRTTRWVDRFADLVGDAIRIVTFGALAVPAVLVPSAYERVAKSDPLTGGGRWARPPLRRAPARASWANDRVPATRSVRRTGVAVVCLTVASVVWWQAVQDARVGPEPQGFGIGIDATGLRGPVRFPAPQGLNKDVDPGGTVAVALRDDPWYRDSLENRNEEAYALDTRVLARHENPYSTLDVTGNVLNMEDGIRRSWTPPPCDCRRITVWMYGGSTTWGMHQRDEHTIASELARAAAAEGLTVDVHNRGMNGFDHWMEAERLAWDLTVDPPPDLVIFYDGVNEMIDDDPQERPTVPTLDTLWDLMGRSDGPVPDGPEGSRFEAPDDSRSPDDLGGSIARRYDRVRQMSQRTAAAHDLPVRYVWQPSRYSRAFEPSEPHLASKEENMARRVVQRACEAQADDVIVLCDALVGADGPIFTDDAHHDERGARIIGAHLFSALRADLEALAAGRAIPSGTG